MPTVYASVGFMAPKPPSSEDPKLAPGEDPELEKKLAADPGVPVAGDKGAASSSVDDKDEEDDDELELDDDEDDEDLVVFTAKEAAGALATIYGFIKPYLGNYKKLLAFVGFGVLVETLFNVIMPLSLKFLIDDALGEEDFQALYKILGVLAFAGIVTSIIAVWYERWDARLAAGVIADVRTRLFEHVQNLPSAYFARTKRGEILSRFSIDLAAFEGSVKSFANSAALPGLELIAGIILMLFLNWQLAAVALLVFPITLIGPRILTPKAVLANYEQKLNESSLLGMVQENVTSQYEGSETPVLDSLSLKLNVGKRIAIVGPSGSGKSTLLNLILRLYVPDEGRLTIDGVDIRRVTLESLRRSMAVVFQENMLFNMSIRENIRLGTEGASDAEVEEAARKAEIHSYIMSLPQKYDTPVGERGDTLSGGQRQRIAIARAIIRNPSVLLLDEATSALDQTTEAAINRTLLKVAKGRTMIWSTHRLASVVEMDEIIVLSGGKVIERGPHAKLLAANGVYRRLWDDQTHKSHEQADRANDDGNDDGDDEE